MALASRRSLFDPSIFCQDLMAPDLWPGHYQLTHTSDLCFYLGGATMTSTHDL